MPRRWFAALLLLLGCSGPPVSITQVPPADTLAATHHSAATDGVLSAHSRIVLDRLGEEHVDRDPRTLLEAVAAKLEQAQDWQSRLALAELQCLVAHKSDPTTSARYHLEAVLATSDILFGNNSGPSPFDPRFQIVAETYDVALGHAFEIWQTKHGHPKGWQKLEGIDTSYKITVHGGKMLDFDRFVVANTVRIKGLRHRHRRAGLGTALVGVRPNNPAPPARPDPFFLTQGVSQPITAVLMREGDALRLNLYHADKENVEIRARSFPLAADFSASLGLLVAGIDPKDYENDGLFSPTQHSFKPGIRALEPYDPKKIPVVLVHGLWSNPVVWRFLVNAIWGDPELRKRYQIWVHLYPTGLPLMASAHAFRQGLDDALVHFAPDVRDPSSHDVVVVGHSLGGVISGTAVKTAGTRLWDSVFTKPLDQVVATPKDKALADNLLFFEARRCVRRVIFICTPHGGSEQATSFIGRLGSMFITRPRHLTGPLRRLLKNNPGILKNYKGIESSVDMLKPNDVILQEIKGLPVAEGVTLHSIIGQEKPGPRKSGSDGVVPYESAHIDGVASELVIRSDHSAEERPACIAEVVRILRLHVRERDRARK